MSERRVPDRARGTLATAGLVLALAGAALVLTLLATHPLARDERLNSPVAMALQVVGLAGLAVAGGLVARRQPGATIAWLMLGAALTWTLATLTLMSATMLLASGSPAARAAGWLTNWSWVPAQGLTMLMLLRFPTGRLPSRRWRSLEVAALGWTAVTTLVTATLPGPLGAETLEPLTNPLGLSQLDRVGDDLLSALFLVLPVLVVAVCSALVVRWRSADAPERRGLRWLAATALVLAVGAPLALVAEAGEIVQGAAFLLLAVAVAAAVLRDRLWDLDLRQRYDRLHEARLQERDRLRRALHDGLGPPLGSVTMRAEAARNLLARGDTLGADDLLISIGTTTEQALAEVRRLIDDLAPLPVHGGDLATALRDHLEAYRMSFPVTMHTDPTPLPALHERAAATAYLVVAEAVRNAARHSGGSAGLVRVRAEGRDLAVDVTDDGRGLRAAPAGIGRTAMAARVAEAGGDLEVRDQTGAGTLVRFRLPGAVR